MGIYVYECTHINMSIEIYMCIYIGIDLFNHKYKSINVYMYSNTYANIQVNSKKPKYQCNRTFCCLCGNKYILHIFEYAYGSIKKTYVYMYIYIYFEVYIDICTHI
jgi:hypothetical protein